MAQFNCRSIRHYILQFVSLSHVHKVLLCEQFEFIMTGNIYTDIYAPIDQYTVVLVFKIFFDVFDFLVVLALFFF